MIGLTILHAFVHVGIPISLMHGSSLQTFLPCKIVFTAARVGIVEAKIATFLHPAVLQWASGHNEWVWSRRGQPTLATQWY